MDLTIIVVNWNTSDLLCNCLRSIEANPSGLKIQTIVVDNNSADDSREAVARSFPEVELLNSGGNVGFARGNNVALGRIRAPMVLFLNPDTEIVGDALGRMVDFLRDHADVGALGCKIRNATGQVAQLGLQWFPSPWTELLRFLAVSRANYQQLPRLFPYRDPEVSGPVTKLFGACLLVRRAVLDTVGSFDERFFMYCEDVDLCRRIHQAGWKLYYLSDAEVLHLGSQATAKAAGPFKTLMSCESFAKLMRKHYGLAGSIGYRLVNLFGAAWRLAALVALRLAGSLGFSGAPEDFAGSARKQLVTLKWTLGLQRPTIRE